MYNTICSYPLSSDLFSLAIHPKKPFLAVGLASGHVQLNQLPPPTGSASLSSTIDTAWRTRRHKGSCRSLCFSGDGEVIFSAGTDGLVKAAKTDSGVVEAKIAVPLHNNEPDPPTLIHALTPSTLLLATDSSALHIHDLRLANTAHITAIPAQIHRPHADYISSLTPLPPSSTSTSATSKQWLSTGGTTVAITDLRRGVLVRSEDQGEELLSSAVVGERVVVGGEKGGLRLWEVGRWDDSEETVVVAPGVGASAEVCVEVTGGERGRVAVGMDDGVVRVLEMGERGKRGVLLGEYRHDEVDGVGGLGFEVGGRMISGGGSVIKVWEEGLAGGFDRCEEEEEEEDDCGEVEAIGGKRSGASGDEDDPDLGGESSEEEKPRKRRKKKRKKSNGMAGGQHVTAFKDLD